MSSNLTPVFGASNAAQKARVQGFLVASKVAKSPSAVVILPHEHFQQQAALYHAHDTNVAFSVGNRVYINDSIFDPNNQKKIAQIMGVQPNSYIPELVISHELAHLNTGTANPALSAKAAALQSAINSVPNTLSPSQQVTDKARYGAELDKVNFQLSRASQEANDKVFTEKGQRILAGAQPNMRANDKSIATYNGLQSQVAARQGQIQPTSAPIATQLSDAPYSLARSQRP